MSSQETWDAYWNAKKGSSPVHLKMVEKVHLILKSLQGQKVLEVGAGSGIDSLHLTKSFGVDPYCIEFSEQSVQRIKYRFTCNGLQCNIVHADLRRIPFRDECFDVTFSSGVLEHFEKTLEVLLEQKRILRKGGVIAIGVPYTYTLHSLKKKILLFAGRWGIGWETQFTKRKLKSLIDRAGMLPCFLFLDCHPRSYLPKRLRGTWINILINGGVVVVAQKP